jgi:hypothetical protein
MMEAELAAKRKATAPKNVAGKKMTAKELTAKFEKLDVFSSLKKYQETSKPKRASASPGVSKAGKLQTNQKPRVSLGYMERTKRGQLETTYNDGVVRLPGSYNTGGAFFVNTDELSMYTNLGKQLTEYPFFNLTADARAESLQTHYE